MNDISERVYWWGTHTCVEIGGALLNTPNVGHNLEHRQAHHTTTLTFTQRKYKTNENKKNYSNLFCIVNKFCV